MKPYDVLAVAPGVSLQDLQSRYKKLALMHHPDKPGGSKEAFELVTRAYQAVRDDLRARDQDKPHDVLKGEFGTPRVVDTKSRDFDLNAFNRVFDGNRLDEEDKGYGSWMRRVVAGKPEAEAPKSRRVSPDRFSAKNFNQAFDEEVPACRRSRALISSTGGVVPVEPKGLAFFELGQQRRTDYSADDLSYCDYKLAHSTQRLVSLADDSSAKRRPKTVAALKKARKNVSYTMSPAELERYRRAQELAETAEEKRVERVKRQDARLDEHFARCSRLLLKSKG
jgi:curved DNA-binding protein CbpA